MATKTLPTVGTGSVGLSRYLDEIRKFPMLEPEEEYMLAKSWVDHEDTDAAHKMVTSHLRLVAKIATGGRMGTVTVSTLKEAEVFGKAGFDDILHAAGILSHAIPGLGELHPAGCTDGEALERRFLALERLDVPTDLLCAFAILFDPMEETREEEALDLLARLRPPKATLEGVARLWRDQ